MLGGDQQDVQQAPSVVLVAVAVSEVTFDVGGDLAEDVQAIPERIEFVTGHDELVFAEPELGGAASRFVVPLATGALAVLAGPSGAFGFREPAATPPAPQATLR